MDVDWDDLERRIHEQDPRGIALATTDADLQRVLDLEAHHLDGEEPISSAFLAQLVLTRAWSLSMTALADSAWARIVAGAHMVLAERWRTEPFSPALCRTLVAERKGISDLAFTPDGRLLSACDGVLREWDVSSGASRRIALEVDDAEPGFPPRVNKLAVSPDGKRVALTFNDHRLRVLHPGSGRLVTVGPTRDWIQRARFLHHDSRGLVTAGHDQVVRLWDVDACEVVHVFSGHTWWVSDVAVSEDDATMVSVSYDGTIRVWDLANATCRQVIEAVEEQWVLAVAFVDNDSAVVVASQNGVLHRFSVRDGHLHDRRPADAIRPGYDGPGRVWGLTTSGPDQLLTMNDDGVVDVWRTSTHDLVRLGSLTGHADRVRIGAVSPDGRHAVSGADDGSLLVWDLATPAVLDPPFGLYPRVKGIASSTVAGLTVGCTLRHLRLVARDINTGEERWRVVDQDPDGLDALWFSTDGAALFTAAEGRVQRRSSTSGRIEASTLVGDHVKTGRGDVAVTVEELYRDVSGYRVAIVDVTNGTVMNAIVLDRSHGYPGNAAVAADLTTVVLSGDGRLTVWRSSDGTVDTIELVDASASTEVRRRADHVHDVAVDDDGCHAVALDGRSRAYVCDLMTRAVSEVRVDDERAPAAAGMSEHRAGVVGSSEGVVTVWDLTTAAVLCRAALDSSPEAVSADGDTLAVGDNAGNTHVLAVLDGGRRPAAFAPFLAHRHASPPVPRPQRSFLGHVLRRR